MSRPGLGPETSHLMCFGNCSPKRVESPSTTAMLDPVNSSFHSFHIAVTNDEKSRSIREFYHRKCKLNRPVLRLQHLLLSNLFRRNEVHDKVRDRLPESL